MPSRRQLLRGGAALTAATSLAGPAHTTSLPRPTAFEGLWGDQGDATFVNPILPADYSDVDAIRVGEDYYAISSTLHLSPGMVILHSRDLVNWRTLGHAVVDTSVVGETLSWRAMKAYGRGVWAGAMRHHRGRFYIYFTSPDDGLYMTSADTPTGPWTPLHRVWAIKGYDDPCPFWDDDGQGYIALTHFELDEATGRKYNIHLFRLSYDGKSLSLESGRILHQSNGSEANKLYKIKGLYYHYFSEVKPEGRTAMMRRSASLEGPWETRQLNHVDKLIDKEPNQGGLIELPTGEWWFLTHQGRGDWEGRALCLLPVNWVDGWPIIGAVGDDGIGNMVWRAAKPVKSHRPPLPLIDDDFNAAVLGPEWEWNHAPRADKWSLTERRGHLRLRAFVPVRGDDFLSAGNTVSVRSRRTRANMVVTRLDISGMGDAQRAGLCHFSRGYALFGVTQMGGVRRLEFQVAGQPCLSGPIIAGRYIWLRSLWGIKGDSQFAYSLDGQTFTEFGPLYTLGWGYYRGDRTGLYSFNPQPKSEAAAGFIDIDRFTYAYADQTGAFAPPSLTLT